MTTRASVLAFGLPLAACGPTVSDADCHAFADTVVASFASCGLPADVDSTTLEARFVDRCLVQARASGSGVTPAWLDACAATLAQTCDPYGTCVPIAGTEPDGAPCGSDVQCASTFCDGTVSCGTCGSRGTYTGECPPGQTLVEYPYSCVPLGALNQVCYSATPYSSSAQLQCAYGLECVVVQSSQGYIESRCEPTSTAPLYIPPVDPRTCN